MQPLISKWNFQSPWQVKTPYSRPGLSIPADVVCMAIARMAQFLGEEKRFNDLLDGLVLSDALPFTSDQLFLPQLFQGRDFRRANGSTGELRVYHASRQRQSCQDVVAVSTTDAGLYVVMDIPDKHRSFMDALLYVLGQNGIGAGRSIGWGRFLPTPLQPLENIKTEDGRALLHGLVGPHHEVMTLSSAWPEAEAVDEVLLTGDYALLPRTWHLAGGQKEPFLLLAAGSCFPKPFAGAVRRRDGTVDALSSWHYARPMFWEVHPWNA